LIHALIWWRQREAWANLLFALMAVGTAALAWFDVALMRAESPAKFASAILWDQLSSWVIVLTLAGFVRLYFSAGRDWLLWTVCGLRTVSLVLNFSTGQNLNYRAITGTRHIQFMGETIYAPAGVVINPWMLIGQLSLYALVIFIIDAAITVWRRGDRRRAVTVGGSIAFFVLASAVQTALVVLRIIPPPGTPSLLFFGVIAATSYELGSEMLRAAQLARDLRASQRQIDKEANAHRNEVAHLMRIASLGELSSALTHELSQPLTAILSNAQAAEIILSRDKCDLEEIRAILRDIVADDGRAREVINRLRLLLKKSEFQAEPLDANQLIQEVLKLMNYDLIARAVRVVTEFAADLPPIRGDRVQLQQVLINLILNASDAMAHPMKNDCLLTLRSSRGDGGVIQISVSDTGTGIPPGGEEKIFEPYHTTKPHGLGLGLSLSRSIVLAHGGRLWAENQSLGGATFHFTIPAWKGN
jgi:signal transduction histidine kinase